MGIIFLRHHDGCRMAPACAVIIMIQVIVCSLCAHPPRGIRRFRSAFVQLVDGLNDGSVGCRLIFAEGVFISAVEPVDLHAEKRQYGDDSDYIECFDSFFHAANLAIIV